MNKECQDSLDNRSESTNFESVLRRKLHIEFGLLIVVLPRNKCQ